MKSFPHESIDRLADRIARGEVVFFIGAGFSLDSENNSAWRLLARLLARYEAMSEVLSAPGGSIWKGLAMERAALLAGQAAELRAALANTFDLECPRGEEHHALLPSTIKKLALEYFPPNDWLCSAFTVLLSLVHEAPSENWRDFIQDVAVREERYLTHEAFLLPTALVERFLARRTRLAEARAAHGPHAVLPPEEPAPSPDEQALLDLLHSTIDDSKVPEKELERGLLAFAGRQFFGQAEFEGAAETALNLNDALWQRLRAPLVQLTRRACLDAVPHDKLDRLDLEKLIDLGRHSGKALFLETLGFLNLTVMRGTPFEKVIAVVEESYARTRGRAASVLRPRHHVLARLAREGLCPIILTTNFDLLIEGAYRVAGFTGRKPEERGDDMLPGKLPPWEPTTCQVTDLRAPPRYASFSAISNAVAFSSFSGGGGTAVVYKIHGCAHEYRMARNGPAWAACLPSVVFTFREIQNWRGDSWSRDLLQNLLRTRTIAFCGYSGMDQVIHDTFRSVYEDMALQRELRAGRPVAGGEPANGTSLTQESAPAFFFNFETSRKFHGLEILRAASRTVGVAMPDPTNHPNYVDFFGLPKPGAAGRFPSLDQSMQWLYHRVIRRQQMSSLQTDLRRAFYALVGHPCDEKDLHSIIVQFCELCAREAHLAARWDDDAGHGAQFARMTGWTECFHSGLLRELSLAEGYLRERGPGLKLAEARRQPGYIPASERRDWTAWMVVVELAARRMAAVWREEAAAWSDDTQYVAPVPGADHTSLVIQHSPERPAPIYLSIRMASPERSTRITGRRGVKSWAVWELQHTGLPWREHPSLPAPGSRQPRTPSAQQIFRWALGVPSECTRDKAATFLNDRSSP